MIHLYDCFGTASKLDWVFLENGGKCDCKRKSSLLVTIKTALISVGRRNWTLDDLHSIMNQLTVNLLTDWRASRAALIWNRRVELCRSFHSDYIMTSLIIILCPSPGLYLYLESVEAQLSRTPSEYLLPSHLYAQRFNDESSAGGAPLDCVF